jgi:tetratricopeptide (TPR) repeat protein
MPTARSLRSRLPFDFALVGAVAVAVRLAHAWFISRTPFFEGPVIDAAVNRGLARQLAGSGELGAAFYQPPLYPVFLSLLYRVGLASAWSVAIVQSLLGAATAVILVAIGRRLTARIELKRAVGLTCGMAAALYGPFVLFDLELLPPCLVDLLLAGALLLALRAGPLNAADAALGLLLGLAVVGWPPSALLGPGLLLLRGRRLAVGRGALLVVALACAAIPVATAARFNARHGGEGVVVSYNLGINLWLGNNPHWRDTWRSRPGAAFEPELERPDRQGATRPAARSAYFVGRVLDDVRRRPLAALARTEEKLYYVWHGREIRRDQDIELLREASPVLRGLLWEAGVAFPFGLLAPLGLLALWRRRQEPDVRYLALSLTAYALILALFFVSSRYRLPMVLLLLPLAAEEAVWLVRSVKRSPRLLVAPAVLLVALNLPSAFTKTFAADAAERGTLTATAWKNQGKREHARTLAAELVQRFPDDPNVLMLRADLLVSAGRCREAEPLLKKTIELAPRTATPRIVLAECYEDLGNLPAAEHELAGALALHPFHPLALRDASLLFLRQHRRIEARALAGRFLAAGYRDPELAAELLQGDDRSGS